MSNPPAEIAAAINSDPAVADAAWFKNEFEPKDGVDYGWVVEEVKAQYAFALKVFDDLDGKAAVIAGYMAGGTGVLTLGSLAAISATQISIWVVIAALPSVILAGLALWLAFQSRRVALVHPSPEMPAAIRYAEYYQDGAKAHAAYAAQLHLCIALLRRVSNRKAAFLNWSAKCFAFAVFALALPLLISVGQKAFPPEPTANLTIPAVT